MTKRSCGSFAILVALLPLACAPQRPDAHKRFYFWAKYVSVEARGAAGAPGSSRSRHEIGELRRRWGISDRELVEILAEAEAAGWANARECQPCPEPYYSNSLLIAPEPMRPIEGRMTPEACARGLQGVVIATAVICADGRATDIVILKGLGAPLDEQAVEAIESNTWLPALLCGQPVSVHYNSAISFRLTSCEGQGAS